MIYLAEGIVIKKDACIDESGRYRYWLMRQWGENSDNFVNFVMLNPSTADAKDDDPTVRCCIRFAKSFKFDGMYITNLFAFRTKDPKELKKQPKPIGSENDIHLRKKAKISKTVVVTWSNHGSFMNRDKEVISILNQEKTIYCLGKNKSGQPTHPSRLKSNTNLIKF